MATFARLKARTANEIGSIDATTDATALGEWANDAVRDVLLQTGVKVSTATVTLDGSDDYTLDTAVISVKYAWVAGNRTMERVTPQNLVDMRASGATPISDGPYVYALDGADLFMVYPDPGSGTVHLHYVPKPTEMSGDSHDPSDSTYGGIPVEFHPVLVDYMCWRAASQDDDSSSAQGQRYMELYQDGLKKIKRHLGTKGGPLPRAIVRRSRLRLPHDRSRY